MIATARLTLRPAQPGDLPALHAIYSDPRAMRHWSRPAHETEAETAELLDRLIRSHATLGPELMILHQGRLIGRAGLWRRWEAGYILHPSTWGKGFATEAMQALCAAAFARHSDCDALTADIDPRNTASARVLQKCGFIVTHQAQNTFFINGEWSHSTYYRLPRPD